MKTLLLLFASATTIVWSWDSTMVFKTGHLEGVIRLDARSNQVTNSPTDLQGVRFDLGQNVSLTLRNIGLPDFNASCNSISYSALIMEHSNGSSGFAGSVDTNWNLAYDFPQHLTPLDSVKDRYPDHTHRNALVGKGWIHSADESKNCQTTRQTPQAGYRRIFYYRSPNGVYIKAQVDGFRTQSVACDTSIHPPCSKSEYVDLRYALTNDAEGLFSNPPSSMRAVRARGLRFHKAYPRPIWEYVLGRMP